MLETYQKMTSIIGIIIISIILYKFTHILLSIMFFIVGIGLITYFESVDSYKLDYTNNYALVVDEYTKSSLPPVFFINIDDRKE